MIAHSQASRLIISQAPMTYQPMVQPTISEIVAHVGIGGMQRAPRPPNSTDDQSLAVEDVRDHVAGQDRGHDYFLHDWSRSSAAGERSEAEAEQEPVPAGLENAIRVMTYSFSAFP